MAFELDENLKQAFIKHRRGEYDQKLDDRLKQEGRKILQENDPKNKSKFVVNIHMVFWMVASMAVFYYTDFYMAIKIDPRVYRLWLYIGCFFLLVNFLLAFYLIFWCSYFKGIDNWESHAPFAIPIATGAFIAGMICCAYALWPVWGIFTPFILFTLFMGIVFLLTLVPV
ncbi:transmembrane protein 128-like [Xenia sp. Carnegie-2017]|uniref:transmembrane protein 128-like n=1 Tax=Xenia sp. Carnegie-2017 TaxID=2897299 RepID=UPI001F03544D|nr:transmembrane protein 128-like [Xenia sp. Carnegie-2017]